MSTKDKQARDNPVFGMRDEKIEETHAIAAGRNEAGTRGEVNWLIQDTVDELKASGHTGGAGGHITRKSDNHNAVKALKDAVDKLLGGRVIQHNPPKGESHPNGRIEEAGKTLRGFASEMKDQVQTKEQYRLVVGEMGCHGPIKVSSGKGWNIGVGKKDRPTL